MRLDCIPGSNQRDEIAIKLSGSVRLGENGHLARRNPTRTSTRLRERWAWSGRYIGEGAEEGNDRVSGRGKSESSSGDGGRRCFTGHF